MHSVKNFNAHGLQHCRKVLEDKRTIEREIFFEATKLFAPLMLLTFSELNNFENENFYSRVSM